MEPERPIEKLLRAWAKKRRQDAVPPLELHPATRRMLQGEVTRKFGKAERKSGSFFEMLVALWPRFVWGLGVFAVLAAVAWLVLPSFNKTNTRGSLAKNEPALETESVKRMPSPTAIAPASAPAEIVDSTGHRPLADNLPTQLGNATLSLENGATHPTADSGLTLKTKSAEGNLATTPLGLAGDNKDRKDINTPAAAAANRDAFRGAREETQ